GRARQAATPGSPGRIAPRTRQDRQGRGASETRSRIHAEKSWRVSSRLDDSARCGNWSAALGFAAPPARFILLQPTSFLKPELAMSWRSLHLLCWGVVFAWQASVWAQDEA